MEHRWHNRGPVDFDVVLYHQGVPVACCAAQNLSANGLLVQPASIGIGVNAAVELEFTVKENNRLQRYRIPAQVIHQSSNGTGLMFQSHRLETREVLATVLDKLTQKSVQ